MRQKLLDDSVFSLPELIGVWVERIRVRPVVYFRRLGFGRGLCDANGMMDASGGVDER